MMLFMSSKPRIAMISFVQRPQNQEAARRLLPLLAPLAEVIEFDLVQQPDLENTAFDFAVVLGGDGSMLRAAHAMGQNQRPVVGVNLGRLGFLADLSLEEFERQISAIISGTLPVVEHLMYRVTVDRRGSTLCKQIGLNEVSILAGPPFAILNVQLLVDGELVTTYSCDGLIVSTPVGSTAHNLSAGGPILRKDLQAFVISPVSPHTLTNRPVVDRADRVYELVVPNPHAGTTALADGRQLTLVEPGDRIRIERATASFRAVSIPGHSYYRTLREKLGWGGSVLPSRTAGGNEPPT
jgi:NAD+ kinase